MLVKLGTGESNGGKIGRKPNWLVFFQTKAVGIVKKGAKR